MQLFTIREVATRLRVSSSTIYDWCAKGEIAHYKLGGSIRISEEQVQAFIERSRVEIEDSPPELKHIILG